MASPRRQVAVIPVRHGLKGPEVCLTRRLDSRKWGIPKGYIDRGDTPEEAALTEAFEEAGIRGQLIGEAIGTYAYKKWNAPLTVLVFVMEVLGEEESWREMRIRKRSWHSVEEAMQMLAGHPVHPLWDVARECIARWSGKGRA